MRRTLPNHRAKFRRRDPGFIITLVAVFILFVVGAMAALSIDIASFYTARSEAQIAADSAALAGARALSNSGLASDPNATTDGLWTLAQALCVNTGTAVGGANQVGGQTVAVGGTINVTCSNPQAGNPLASAQVQVLAPAFFARIWGTTQVLIAATATAEVYNPSLVATNLSLPQAVPVALSCVKPWLISNVDPLNTTKKIFDRVNGQILDTTLLGGQRPGLLVNCAGGLCSGAGQGPPTAPWSYYPGDTSSTGEFAAPPSTSVSCSPATTNFTSTDYQLAIAGCVQTPIRCNEAVHIDLINYSNRDSETAAAVSCLSHSATNLGDTIDPATFPAGPFEFVPGAENPLVAAGLSSANDVVVSDSLVTVPVFDDTTYTVGNTTVNLVGFVQLFMNPDGFATPAGGPISRVVNLVGCGTSAAGNPVYGNGATAVPVRLITPP